LDAYKNLAAEVISIMNEFDKNKQIGKKYIRRKTLKVYKSE